MPKQNQEMRELTPEEAAKSRRLREVFEDYKRTHEPRLTKKQLAADLGWSQATVNFYINGKLALNYAAIFRFSARFRIDPRTIDPTIPAARAEAGDNFIDLYQQLSEDQQAVVAQLVEALSKSQVKPGS